MHILRRMVPTPQWNLCTTGTIVTSETVFYIKVSLIERYGNVSRTCALNREVSFIWRILNRKIPLYSHATSFPIYSVSILYSCVVVTALFLTLLLWLSHVKIDYTLWLISTWFFTVGTINTKYCTGKQFTHWCVSVCACVCLCVCPRRSSRMYELGVPVQWQFLCEDAV